MGIEVDRPLGLPSPDYSVRVSARAKRVRLVMTSQGLEVVVPRGFSRRKIPDLVAGKRAWIERTARQMQARRRLAAAQAATLPEVVILPAVGERWKVEYRSTGTTDRPGATVRQRPGWRLVVTGDPADSGSRRAALRRWLSRRARSELPARLARLARESGLSYEKVSIRQQRTRWGSCSRKRCISLNAKLLLMPTAVVDYVLLHELCHTVEMSHSGRFWALVERHDPEYREHRRLAKRAAEAMPGWLNCEPGNWAL